MKTQTANILTLLSLSLGGSSILAAMENEIYTGMLLIFLAALCDRLDGAAARRLHIVSDFGKQLDSLSDIISFGLAPALLLYQGILHELGAVGGFCVILYAGCGALRLARFNISGCTAFFTGLPITAAGCAAALSCLAIPYGPPVIFMILLSLLSILMISPLKVKKI
nr:CDP-diacylglycerol--serine O-phosphatidyltransferase [Bacillus massiliglaciei]